MKVLSTMKMSLQGCFLILQSYLQYFRAISHTMQQEHVVQLLIEAIGTPFLFNLNFNS